MSDNISKDIFLEELPDQIGATVRGVPYLNQGLMRSFFRRAHLSGTNLKDLYILQKYGIDIHFIINKTTDGQFLIFFNRKKRRAEVVIDIFLQFQVEVDLKGRPVEQAAKAQLFKWEVPPFLVVDQEQRQAMLSTISKRPFPSSTTLTLMGREGQQLLIDFKRKATVEGGKFRPKANIWFEQEPVVKKKKRYPAQPFLIIYESIRSWVAGNWRSDHVEPVIPGTGNDVHMVVSALAEGYRTAKLHLADQGGLDPGLKPLLDHYDVNGFHANLLLRLDGAGEFAITDSRHSYQLGLDMNIIEKSLHYEGLISMSIPDFLIKGELFEAFWDLFLPRDEAVERRTALRNAMADEAIPAPSDRELLRFLRSGKRNHSSVFRVDRNRRIDFNLFFISGMYKGKFTTLVFSGKFEVRSVHPPKISYPNNEKLKVHYFSDGQDGFVDQDFVDYFLRLLWYFNKWTALL